VVDDVLVVFAPCVCVVGAQVYDNSSWSYLDGALETVDREYGWPIDSLHHHISDCHVVHHLFFTQVCTRPTPRQAAAPCAARASATLRLRRCWCREVRPPSRRRRLQSLCPCLTLPAAPMSPTQIPHYHLWEATQAIKPLLQTRYKCVPTPHAFLAVIAEKWMHPHLTVQQIVGPKKAC
jgi:hypothetical protein